MPLSPAAFPGLLSAQWGRMRPTVANRHREGPGHAEDGLLAVSVSLAKGWGEAELLPAWPLWDCGLCDRRRRGEDSSRARESRLLLVTPSSALQLASKTRAMWSRHCREEDECMGDIFHLGFPALSPLPRLFAPPERAQLKGPAPHRAHWI